MANPKAGLNYYTVDTDRYQDRRIKRLKKDFGCKGIAVYDYVLSEVYRVRGCFAEWDNDTAFDVAEYFGLKESVVREIVEYCGTVGLFDKELLSRGVVTSAAIQRRYLEMCNRAKRLNPIIPEKIKIITEECRIIPEESPQSKVKESKEKKIKENNISIDALVAQQREKIFSIFFFNNFIKPEQEVENFITHYAANGWRRSGGIAIRTAEQLIACARQWKPKNDKPRFDENLLVRYHKFYDAVIRGGKWGQQQLSTLLHGLVSLKWADLAQTRIDIRCSRELAELLCPHVDKVAEAMGCGVRII